MALLTRDAILAADDRETVDVDCPEWGGTVRLRSISGRERDAYEQSCIVGKGKSRDVNMRNARAKLIVLCAVDETGGKMFSDSDLAGLGRKNARPIDRLFEAAQKLCGLRDEDVEEMTEDFGAAAPSEDSTTD
jgi:hypothetical protein